MIIVYSLYQFTFRDSNMIVESIMNNPMDPASKA